MLWGGFFLCREVQLYEQFTLGNKIEALVENSKLKRKRGEYNHSSSRKINFVRLIVIVCSPTGSWKEPISLP